MRASRLILAAALLLTSSYKASACGYGGPSPLERLAISDCLVIGKVVAIEPKSLKLSLQPNTPTMPFSVVTLKVEEMLRGDDRLTHVRIALARHQVMPIGFEGCFFLTAHRDESVYLPISDIYDYPIVRQGNAGFGNEIKELRRLAGLLKNPKASLQSANPRDRFTTAAMLVVQIRRGVRGVSQQTATNPAPFDADLNRLVMRALADADWQRDAADFRLNPWRVFNMLGMTAADGWDATQANDGKTREENVRRWLRTHENTFRIQPVTPKL